MVVHLTWNMVPEEHVILSWKCIWHGTWYPKNMWYYHGSAFDMEHGTCGTCDVTVPCYSALDMEHTVFRSGQFNKRGGGLKSYLIQLLNTFYNNFISLITSSLQHTLFFVSYFYTDQLNNFNKKTSHFIFKNKNKSQCYCKTVPAGESQKNSSLSSYWLLEKSFRPIREEEETWQLINEEETKLPTNKRRGNKAGDQSEKS